MSETTEVYKATPADKRQIQLNKDVMLPTDRYTVRLKDVVYGPSSKGNFMFTVTPELVFPDSFVAVNGTTINIAGVNLKQQYITLKIKGEDGNWDKEATQKAVDRFLDQLDKFGVDTSVLREEGIDLNNPDKKLLDGLVLDAICGSEEYVRRKDLTPEQKAKGIKQGDEIKDANGKAIKSYSHIVKEFLGAGSTEGVASAANKAF